MAILSERYNRAFRFTVQWEVEFEKGHEGDYNFARTENDPDDPGGLTKYGVDQRSFPNVDIKHLTYDGAALLYNIKAWVPCCCEQLELGTGEVVFDMAVNVGNHEAILLLQRAINNDHPAMTTQIKEDGYIGPQTILAANTMDAHKAVLDLFEKRKWYYAYIAFKRNKLKKFLSGWNNRNIAVKKFAYSIARDNQYA